MVSSPFLNTMEISEHTNLGLFLLFMTLYICLISVLINNWCLPALQKSNVLKLKYLLVLNPMSPSCLCLHRRQVWLGPCVQGPPFRVILMSRTSLKYFHFLKDYAVWVGRWRCFCLKTARTCPPFLGRGVWRGGRTGRGRLNQLSLCPSCSGGVSERRLGVGCSLCLAGTPLHTGHKGGLSNSNHSWQSNTAGLFFKIQTQNHFYYYIKIVNISYRSLPGKPFSFLLKIIFTLRWQVQLKETMACQSRWQICPGRPAEGDGQVTAQRAQALPATALHTCPGRTACLCGMV